MAKSRTAAITAGAALAALAASGCGAASTTATARPVATKDTVAGSVPAGWRTARSPLGATLSYPASWQQVSGDADTLSAQLREHGHIVGYLNLTPRQGDERISNWASFRIAHQRGEVLDVRLISAVAHRRFRTGTGACVTDSYTTTSAARYIELACLIEGRQPAVVLGAAPPQDWATRAPVIEQAIEAATP